MLAWNMLVNQEGTDVNFYVPPPRSTRQRPSTPAPLTRYLQSVLERPNGSWRGRRPPLNFYPLWMPASPPQAGLPSASHSTARTEECGAEQASA